MHSGHRRSARPDSSRILRADAHRASPARACAVTPHPGQSTNVIESAFSIVETVCRNVKRWRAGDHIERWVGSGLLVAERQFRKVQGYREIPALLSALANTVSKKGVAEEVKVA
jgi:hypothetical protein